MRERRPIASDRKATRTDPLIANLFLALKRMVHPKMNVESAERGNIHKTKKIITCQTKKTRASRVVSTAKKVLKNPSSTVLSSPLLNCPDI